MEVKEKLGKWKGHIVTKLRDLNGVLIEEKHYENIVVNVAKNRFAGILNNESGFTGVVNYGAVGTGTNTPAATDTTLQTEVGRSLINSQGRAANVTTFEFYYAPADANGALKEFGCFIDGTASADSGFLLNRAAIDVTKTSLTSLTIEVSITVS